MQLLIQDSEYRNKEEEAHQTGFCLRNTEKKHLPKVLLALKDDGNSWPFSGQEYS